MRTRPSDTRPLNVLFLITSMEIGGAETLLVNMMRRFDPARIVPQVACLKQAGELGEEISDHFRTHSQLIRGKFDALVVGRLARLMRRESIDAVITVGAGDKMFWGRLAARQARIPVILSALHSTGWPDGVGRLNRLLTPVTDGFIAVAEGHRRYLVDQEGFPESRVYLIPNGIDTDRFVFDPRQRARWRQQYGIPESSPVCGIVAALRPEKNHELFLELCEVAGQQIPDAHFLIVGDGARRAHLQELQQQLSCSQRIHFTGNSHDIPGGLSAMDLFALTSHNEASPVSILEAMSVGLPVVAPQVGSIDQAVIDGRTGFLAPPGDRDGFAGLWLQLLGDASLRQTTGEAARRHVLKYGSLDTMTEGYTRLVEELFSRKTGLRGWPVVTHGSAGTPVTTGNVCQS
jgi:glycosyltransferase involved in cell wall biosynthesis